MDDVKCYDSFTEKTVEAVATNISQNSEQIKRYGIYTFNTISVSFQ